MTAQVRRYITVASMLIIFGAMSCGKDDPEIKDQIPSVNSPERDAGDESNDDTGLGDSLDATDNDKLDDIGEEDADVEDDITEENPDIEDDIDPEEPDGEGGDADIVDDEDLLVEGPCGTMLKYGVLDWGENRIEIDLDEFATTESTTNCVGGGGGGRVALVEISAPHSVAGMLSVEVQEGLAMEIRRAHCDESGLNYGCFTEDVEMFLQPTVRHYLLIEELEAGPSERELLLTLEELLTCPEHYGESSCVGTGRLEICHTFQGSPDVPRRFRVSCPNGICEGGRCEGDRCQNPIQVSSEFAWSGSNMGFIDFHDRAQEIGYAISENKDPTCLAEGEALGQPLATKGRELVFHLPELEEGQLVTVDVETIPLSSAIVYMKQSCDEEAACSAVWTADEDMRFEVVDGGDYFLFVDSAHDMDIHFDISIKVEAP